MEYISLVLSVLSIVLTIICLSGIAEIAKDNYDLSNERKEDKKDFNLLLDHLKLKVEKDKRIIKK